jgi:hypothetical protein
MAHAVMRERIRRASSSFAPMMGVGAVVGLRIGAVLHKHVGLGAYLASKE